MSQNVLMI